MCSAIKLPSSRSVAAAYAHRCPGNLGALVIGLVLLASGSASAIEELQQPSSAAWDVLRTSLYADARIGIANDAFMRIELPANTPDPAATAVAIHFGDESIGRIKHLRVIIDNNPAPIAATFDVAADAALVQLDLRVRIDRYTSVRAIAEAADGTLTMRSGWVKASGGCSAAPAAGEAGTPGEIRIRESDDARAVLVSVRHPNHSGFQIDPVSGETIAPYFIRQLSISAGGERVLSVETGISLSENPSLRVAFKAPMRAPITVDAIDSTEASFTATSPPRAVAGAAGAP